MNIVDKIHAGLVEMHKRNAPARIIVTTRSVWDACRAVYGLGPDPLGGSRLTPIGMLFGLPVRIAETKVGAYVLGDLTFNIDNISTLLILEDK